MNSAASSNELAALVYLHFPNGVSPYFVNGSTFALQLKFLWVIVLIGLVASISVAGAEGNRDDGARIFAAKCARCHGREGKGDGPDLVKLQSAVSPDDWTDKESNQELTDNFIIAMITKGGKANGKSRIMPAFGDKLNPQQVQDLLAFIRSLPK